MKFWDGFRPEFNLDAVPSALDVIVYSAKMSSFQVKHLKTLQFTFLSHYNPWMLVVSYNHFLLQTYLYLMSIWKQKQKWFFFIAWNKFSYSFLSYCERIWLQNLLFNHGLSVVDLLAGCSVQQGSDALRGQAPASNLLFFLGGGSSKEHQGPKKEKEFWLSKCSNPLRESGYSSSWQKQLSVWC